MAIRLANQGAIRSRDISPALRAALSTAAIQAGVDEIRVTSGGQPAKGGKSVRTGSPRHNDGNAADLQLVVDGRVLDFNNKADKPIIENFVTAAVGAGAQGVGAGNRYMGGKTLHIGFGAPAAWGAGGAAINAPSWLKAAWKKGLANPIQPDPNAVVAFEQGGYPRDPFGVVASKEQPQTAQSAIADLVNPGGGTQVPEPPTAAMGFAPTLPEMASFTPPAPAPPATPRPPVEMPPQWASAAGFPIDEALTGASAQDVLMGGPRPSPNRPPMPASGPVGPTTAAGVLDMGPRPRPDTFVINPVSGAPDAGSVPSPNLSPRAQSEMARIDAAMMPRPRPGGAPDASRVPTPPVNPRRDPFGFPIDVNRPALANGDGSISTEETTTFDAAEVGMPSEIVTVPTIIGGRRVSEDEAKAAFAAGQNPPVQRGFPSFDAAETAAQARTDAIPGARATGPGPFVSSFPARPELPATGLPAARAADPSRTAAIQGIIDQGISDPNEIWGYLNLDRDGNLVGDITTNEIHAVLDRGGYRAPDATAAIADEFGPGLPTFGGPQSVSTAPNFEVRPASFQTPFAGRPEVSGSLPAAPFRPTNMEPASAPIMADPLFDIDRELADSMDRMRSERESLNLANDIGFTRRQMEPFTPAFRQPPDATMGERFDAANAFPNAGQMFSLPSLNDASFPAPPPVIGTAEAGSTTGEFFSPAPPMPAPAPDLMSRRFDDAFAPAAPGMIADLPGAFASRQAATPPTRTARDGIESVFGPTPAPAAQVPNLAIPFSEVPGFDMSRFAGSSTAEASPITSPLPQPAMPPPSITKADFDARFGGGSVIRPPTPVPGQPGVVQGTMPTPAGAMDIRPPAQGGPAFTPAAPLPGRAPPVEPPRQTNAGAVRNGGRGILGGIVGGALGGPIGALAGGLLGRSGIFGGGGGNGFGFGGAPSFAWSSGGNAPYGNNGGSTTYQKGTSNALGGSNALSWQGSKGQTVTAIQDPFSGQYFTSYGPTTTGGGLY